jgi:hypothetical protein
VKCGYVRTSVAAGDPMTAEMLGWLAGELRRPS